MIGKLKVTHTESKTPLIQIESEGKVFTIPKSVRGALNASDDGVEVEFDTESGTVIKMEVLGNSSRQKTEPKMDDGKQAQIMLTHGQNVMLGTLIVGDSPQKKIVAHVLVSGKPYTVPKEVKTGLTLADNGRKVRFEMINNQMKNLAFVDSPQPVKATVQKKFHEQPQAIAPEQNRESAKTVRPQINISRAVQCTPLQPASAPYNFVPYATTITPAVTEVDRSQFMPGHLSGYIDLQFVALTEIYVRDTANESQAADPKYESRSNPDFYSPGGRFAIPGSSIRGMVRSLVEIVSGSRFGQIDDRHLYMRAMADMSNVRTYYTGRIVKSDQTLKGVGKYKVSAGHLYKVGRTYYIIPAQLGRNNAQFERYHGNERLEPYCHKVLSDGSALIRSGKKINRSKRGHDSDVWHINAPVSDQSQALALTEREVESYRKDTTRGNTKEFNDQSNLILKADKGGKVPCFFIVEKTDNGRHISFGHTAMFRIVYLNSLKQLVRQQDDGSPDFTEGFFGRVDEASVSAIAGRLRFEDALCTSSHAPAQEVVPQILLAPKPTTFQHYLVQMNQDKKQLQHYGMQNAELRGTKLYWHRKGYDWKAKEKVTQNVSTKIRVMPKGSTYGGRVYFDNLHPAELGALMFVLDLPQGCAHKVGMGKPIGLGSVGYRQNCMSKI